MKLPKKWAIFAHKEEPTYTEGERSDPFGPYAHDTSCPAHSRKHGHYCTEWDGLWICSDCEEFNACLCFKDKNETA